MAKVPIKFVGVHHEGWLRPSEIQEIRDFWSDCDAILLEHTSSSADDGSLARSRETFKNLASGDWVANDCIPVFLRASKYEFMELGDLFWLSLWQLIGGIEKPVYLEADTWADEDGPMPAGRKEAVTELVMQSVCEGNREGLREVIPAHYDQQSQEGVSLRDAHTNQWLAQQGDRTWGALFGISHSFGAITTRRDYGSSALFQSEHRERMVLYMILSFLPSPILDLFAPMDACISLAHEISQITGDQLDTIWHILEVNSSGFSEGQYRAQLNRIVAQLRYIRPALNHLWRAEYESEFAEVFRLPLGEMRLMAGAAGIRDFFEH